MYLLIFECFYNNLEKVNFLQEINSNIIPMFIPNAQIYLYLMKPTKSYISIVSLMFMIIYSIYNYFRNHSVLTYEVTHEV